MKKNIREIVLTTAIRLMAQYGYEAVSMRQIASESGIKTATIYTYFENKQDVMDQVLAYIDHLLTRYKISREELTERLKTEPPAQILTNFILSYEGNDQEFLLTVCRMLFREQYVSRRVRNLAHKVFIKEPVANIKQAIDTLVELGAVPPCDSRAIAELWSRTYVIYSVQATHSMDNVDYREYMEIGRFFIDIICRGTRPLSIDNIDLQWDWQQISDPPFGDKPGTEQLILEKALELFSEQGYEPVSMRQIANEVGIKGGSIYKHFSSKSEIMHEIVEMMVANYHRYSANDEAFQAVLQSYDPTRLALSLAGPYPMAQQDIIFKIYCILFREQYTNEDIKDFYLSSIYRECGVVCKNLDQMITEGRIPPAETRKIAIAYIYTMNSMAVGNTLFPTYMEELNLIRNRVIALLVSIALYGFQS